MKKLYSIIKYREFKNPKTYFFEETVLSIICSKCKNEGKQYLKKKNRLLKILVLIEDI